MKKILSKILAFALVVTLSGAVSLFGACTPQEPIDYEHTIIFYSSQGDSLVSVTANAITAFEEKYPGWKVEHSQPGGYDEVKDKVVADFTAQSQPDLAYCYPDHVAQYLQSGKVVSLNQFINSTDTAKWNITAEDGTTTVKDSGETIGYSADELKDFVPSYWVEGLATNFAGYDTHGFKAEDMLTIPFVRSTELMYYNKTAVEALGFTVPETWDELWAQCDAIMKKYPSATPLGYDSEANWFITMCEQNNLGYTSIDNQEHFLFNTEAHAAWLAQLKTYFEKGYFTTQEVYGSYTSGLFTKGVDNGGLVYCIGSSGGASHQDPNGKFDWGVAPIPGTKLADGTVDKSVISQGPSLVMLKGGNGVTNVEEKQVMTFMFIKELLDAEFQASFSMESGYNSVRYSTSDNAAYKKFITGGTIKAAAVKTGEGMRNDFFISPAFKGSSDARTEAGNVILYAIRGEKEPTKALADAYNNLKGHNAK